ncbi:SDR family NAD(P)-dependent oxidoreductase [Pseudarthrobacter sp. MM222]|uniref:SDR family NAD(P)-dependent oxidoreductase n=1 Tax=Pseudarthrobacter sp. MM222 TaxID=3018929 RepID=UPI00221EC3E2|nr:SDR family oxidoreductase [Pseudarthrobacter sp. MM222]
MIPLSRAILVTGAARGIGKAVADKFARSGDIVMLHYGQSHAAAQDAVQHLPGQGHGLFSADLRDPRQIQELVAETVKQLGRVDVLVNCAAAPMVAHPIEKVSFEDWQNSWKAMLEVNLTGAANITYCAAQQMILQGDGGRIINIGSRGASRGEPEHPAYGASKAALHSMGQSMAVALAPHNVAVTTVAPGFVATERNSGRLAGAEAADILSQSPLGRVATPEEIAAAVYFLASTEAMWATGAVIDLNGASYLRA